LLLKFLINRIKKKKVRKLFEEPSYHMEILLGDFNTNVGRENILKPTTVNDSLHQDSNDNGVRIVYFAT